MASAQWAAASSHCYVAVHVRARGLAKLGLRALPYARVVHLCVYLCVSGFDPRVSAVVGS